MFDFMRDSVTMTQRSIIHMLRNVDALITGVAVPIVLMLLFVVIFGGSISTGTSYVNYIVPGAILTCIGYGSSSTAMIVAKDMTGGLFNRFRTMPISQLSILIGHVNGSLVRNAISTTIVIGVALLLGFQPNATFLEWLAVAGILLLVIGAFSWFAVVIGLLVKSVDAAAGAAFSIMFLPYISSAFVKLEELPVWLQGFAQSQPMTPIIESLRGFLIGASSNSWVTALIWLIGILGVTFAAALLVLRERNRR